MFTFLKKKATADVTLNFTKNEEVAYNQYESGFFMYDDKVFFKVKGGSGKEISSMESFASVVTSKSEGSVRFTDIGKISIIPLSVI